MKIYLLPRLPAPPISPNPGHNKADYGVEQDFMVYLRGHPRLLTDDPAAADWHYLPVHWTRLYVRAGCPEERGLLQDEIEKRVIEPARTFTVTQYAFGPLDCPDEAVQFVTSRQGEKGVDIPLLCDALPMPAKRPEKKWLASFIGRLRTHPTLRYDMARVLGRHEFIDIQDGDKGAAFFADQMLRSYVALAPRGSGSTSFRFYEAMQLGVCPMLIGDIDNRPFKKWIDWKTCSAYAETVEEAEGLLENTLRGEWLWRGTDARLIYNEYLAYGKWCEYVLKELEDADKLERGHSCQPADTWRDTHWGT